MKTVKSNILSLTDYAVEQDLTRIKLNQNESPFDIPDLLKQQIWDRMEKASWNRYPSDKADALIRAIAGYTGFPASGIMAGNGSNEIIQTLIYATCDSADRAVLVKPCFSVYKRIAEIMNIKAVEIPLLEDFQFDMKRLISAGKSARILILSTPNNPTGTTLQPDQIKDIAAHVPCLVAVDEAYYEFSGKTVQPLLKSFDNIIVLRTFSKALRLANLRIGYLMGKPELVKELAKCRLPFSIGSFQQIAGEFVLRNKEKLLSYTGQVRKERQRVYEELKKIDSIKPIPSEANFILFKTERICGKELYEALLDRGILIRYFSGSLLGSWLRVTIGNPEENGKFINALGNAVGRR
jgi:histidinol-phosphate aminotransferase